MFHDYSCDIILFDTFQINKIKVIVFRSKKISSKIRLNFFKKRISIRDIARGLIYLSKWHNIPLVSQPFCINPYLLAQVLELNLMRGKKLVVSGNT
jgi:hypothetical protein